MFNKDKTERQKKGIKGMFAIFPSLIFHPDSYFAGAGS
jgi:hypothetical protein